MKIIVDRETAVLAVCKLLNLTYQEFVLVEGKPLKVVPMDEIVFDFESEGK